MNKTKKIIATIMLFIMILGIVQPIFAVSGTGSWVGGQYASGLTTTDSYNGGNGIIIRKLINRDTGEALTVFCAEHGVEFKTDRVYTGSYSNPQTQEIKEACKVAYFGWYGKHGDYLVNGGMLTSDWLWLVEDYVFTQQYIWEKLGQSNATFTDGDIQSDYEDFKRTIDSQIEEIRRRPSFDGTTITIQAGDTKELNDTNGVLANYTTIDRTENGIRIRHTYGENVMYVSVDENTTLEEYIITDNMFRNWGMVKVDSLDNDTTIYFTFDGGAQSQLYSMNYNDPVTLSISLNIELYGKLELTKLDMEHNLIDGAVYNVSGENFNQDVIVTNGKITLENIKKGTYKIYEKSCPTGYLKDINIYSVEVTPNKTTKQAIVNDEPTGIIRAYKVSEYGDKIGGAELLLYADENITNKAGTKTYYTKGQLVDTLITENETGIAEKTGLPLGRYKLVERKSTNRLSIK